MTIHRIGCKNVSIYFKAHPLHAGMSLCSTSQIRLEQLDLKTIDDKPGPSSSNNVEVNKTTAEEWSTIPLDSSPSKKANSAPINSITLLLDLKLKGFNLAVSRARDWSSGFSVQKGRYTKSATCVENKEGGQAALDSKFLELSPPKLVLAENALTSPQSIDPCKGMRVGPHEPPHPIDSAPKLQVTPFTMLQDPFGRSANDRLRNFRPTPSQHDPDTSLNCQHPYQTMPETETWSNRIRYWWSGSVRDTSSSHNWPQPISVVVANSVNQSTASFIPMQDIGMSLENILEQPSYTPLAQPIESSKSRSQSLIQVQESLFRNFIGCFCF